MDEPSSCLGVCFAGNQLYFAVSDPEQAGYLKHIGCIDFSFPVKASIPDTRDGTFTVVQNSLSGLKEKYSCRSVRSLSFADQECWTIFPRLVYETPDERDAHLAVLMDNKPREEIETTWYPLSNQDYRLLLVRNELIQKAQRQLISSFPEAEIVPEFEIGTLWHRLTGVKGSYLTVNCHSNFLTVSSFLLGKLRAATYIPYDLIHDLPYLWNFYGQTLSWMHGIHEQVYVYGQKGFEVMEVMKTFFEETGDAILMNSLEAIHVNASESTYGFRLESAFPAILLSLNVQKSAE